MDLSKSSKGLGLGSKGERVAYGDPANFSQKHPEAEMAATWEKLRLDITGALASDWFGLKDTDELHLNVQIGDLGTPREFKACSLARRVLDFLDLRVPVGYRHGLVQITSNLFVNANDLDGESQSSFIEGGDADQTWFAPWGTTFGSRVFVNMKSYVDENGVETVAFFLQGLIASRPAEVDEAGELTDYEKDLRRTRIHELAKRLLYLAETPFPSSMANLSRQIAYSDVEQQEWPTPFYTIADKELALCPFEDSFGGAQVNAHIFPQVVSLGWSFRRISEKNIDPVISTIIDSLVRIASILEDGFRNFFEKGVPYGWHNIFGGPEDPAWDEYAPHVRSSIPRWVPLSHMGSLTATTAESYSQASKNRDEPGLTWVAQFGAGENVSDAINTLAYSSLIPSGRYEDAVGYLGTAISLDHHDQSTNALSNLGQVYVAIGDFETAEATFLKALARSDKFSEGEASLELGKLYLSQGNTAQATEYLLRAEASGRSPYVDEARKLLSGKIRTGADLSGDNSANTGSPASSKFCTNCGVKLKTLGQKFCGECGSKLD